MAHLTGRDREEMAAANERLEKERERDTVVSAPRERPDVQLIQRRNGHEWLTGDGVPVKRRVERPAPPKPGA